MKDLSMHIMDIIQNSIRAEASEVNLIISENIKDDKLSISIEDNGRGMSAETLEKVADPFFTTRTTRKVGLGLSLLKQNAEKTGGNMNISSELEKGTKLEVNFSYSHIDRPILGDLAGTVALIAGANPCMDFTYYHNTKKGTYIFKTKEVKDVLGDISISNPNIIKYLKELISENLKTII